MAEHTKKPETPQFTGKSEQSGNKVEQRARREALGTGLRRAYQKVLSEPIPEEFSALLNRLSDTDTGRGED